MSIFYSIKGYGDVYEHHECNTLDEAMSLKRSLNISNIQIFEDYWVRLSEHPFGHLDSWKLISSRQVL